MIQPIVGYLALSLGGLCVYALVMMLVNRTVVEVTKEHVSISHGPLPGLLRRRIVNAREIAQVYCEEHSWRMKIGVTDYDYELKVILVDGRRVSLLPDIPNAQQAAFLEQEIERRLGIIDRPVSSEYSVKTHSTAEDRS